MECKSSTRARRFVSIAGRGFCFHARTCGRAGWLLGAFVWPPIKLSYLLIMTEIRTRPLTTYGNTRTNVRGTWSSLTDYVPCTPASNLVLSHVISFQISLSRNFEAQYRSVNQFSLKFIYFLFADQTCHCCSYLSLIMTSYQPACRLLTWAKCSKVMGLNNK